MIIANNNEDLIFQPEVDRTIPNWRDFRDMAIMTSIAVSAILFFNLGVPIYKYLIKPIMKLFGGGSE